jgi:membrane protein
MIGWLRNAAGVLWRTIERWQADDGFVVSASMAYYGSLSLFPLVLVLFAGVGAVVRASSLMQAERTEFLDGIGQSVSPWLAEQLTRLLAGIEDHATTGGPIGMLLLLATVLGLFVQFDYLLDRLWGTPRPAAPVWWKTITRWIGDRLRAFLLLLLCGGLIVAALTVKVALTAFQARTGGLPTIPGLGTIAPVLLTWLLQALAFTVIYKTLPPHPVGWRQAAAGGIAVTLLWDIGQRLLTTWVIGQHYSAYGVVGVFMAVMLWMYYASAAVFFGLELVWVLVHEPTPTRRSDDADTSARAA